MVKALKPFGMDGELPAPPLTVDAPLEQRLEFATLAELGVGSVLKAFGEQVPQPEGITTTSTTITGVDGNEITLYISRPAGQDGPLPGVVHFHGGGMAICSAADIQYVRMREMLAAAGLVVVGVEFRNSGGALGPHPFPAGLDDCASATRWTYDNRAELGISHLIVSGESGGGNLTLTVALKAKREGWIEQIAGAYAMCPYISNRWLEDTDELPSLRENDEYFISRLQLALLGSLYDPDKQHEQDGTCWAGVATDAELEGLPPHVISVNELDPLRDEGLTYYRRLAGAGVSVVGRIVAGTCHAGDVLLAGAMPEVAAATIRDIAGFAGTLS